MKYSFAFSVLLLAVLCGCGDRTSSGRLAEAAEAAESGNWARSLKLSGKVCDRDPKNVPALLMRALGCEQSGEFDPALDSARRAAELLPGDFSAQYTLGRLYFTDANRRGEAMEVLKKALALRPDDENTLILLCNAGTMLDSPGTLSYLARLRRNKKYMTSPELHYQLALYYYRRGDRNTGAKMLNYAVAVGRGNPRLIVNAARCFDTFGAPRNARMLYREYLKLAGAGTPERAEAERRLRKLK